MSMRRLTVFLSSTGRDLSVYRQALIDHMRPLDGFRCDCMEDFGARDAGAVALCRTRFREADVVVGLIGHYRGWEPTGDNAQRSITEMEYDWSIEHGSSRLMFVAPEGQVEVADLEMTLDQRSRQTAFRQRVMAATNETYDRRFYEGKFGSPGALAAAVMAALANVQYRRMLLAIEAAPTGASVRQDKSPARSGAKGSWLDWLKGHSFAKDVILEGQSAGVAVGPAAASPAKPSAAPTANPATALAAFTHDPAYAPLLADPAAFDIAKLEAAVEARSQARLGLAQSERRAAAADYMRLAELTGYFDIEKSRDFYGRAVAADKTDGWALAHFAERCRQTGCSALAETAFAHFDPIAAAAADARGAFWAQIGYGDLCVELGDLARARNAFEGALHVAQQASSQDPGNAGWQRDVSVSYDRVGDVLVAQGQLPAALVAFRDGLAIRERLSKADPGNAGWQRDVFVSYTKVGDVLVAQGQLPAALVAFRDGLAITERLAKADPGNAVWQRDVSVSYHRVGDVLMAQGQLPAALVAFRDGLAIRERLSKADAGNAEWQRDVSLSYDKVGDVLVAQGQLPAALVAFRDGLAIAERLSKADPGNAGWQRDVSVSYERVGDVLVAQGQLPAALVAFRDGLAIAERLSKADPGNAGWQRDVALGHARLANILRRTGDGATARESLAKGRAIVARLAAASPTDATLPGDLAWFDAQLAELDAK